MSAHTLTYGQKARQYDTADFQDPSVKRIIKKLSDIERAALNKTELEEVRMKCFYFYKSPLFKYMFWAFLPLSDRIVEVDRKWGAERGEITWKRPPGLRFKPGPAAACSTH